MMYHEEYRAFLGLRRTEEAIRYIKSLFQEKLADRLNLSRVSAPLFVLSDTGVNDGLSGVETPVSFLVKDINENNNTLWVIVGKSLSVMGTLVLAAAVVVATTAAMTRRSRS